MAAVGLALSETVEQISEAYSRAAILRQGTLAAARELGESRDQKPKSLSANFVQSAKLASLHLFAKPRGARGAHTGSSETSKCGEVVLALGESGDSPIMPGILIRCRSAHGNTLAPRDRRRFRDRSRSLARNPRIDEP